MAKKENCDFVHLRVHSSYSLSEGAITPDELVSLCKKYHMPAVAVTDSANLFGSLEFSNIAAKEGIQPIIGCCFNFYITSDESKKKDKIVLLAKDHQGYLNLLKLIKISYFDNKAYDCACITMESLLELNAGLIVLTAGMEGSLARLLLQGQEKRAEQFIDDLKKVFTDRLYIEIVRHGLDKEDEAELAMLDLAYSKDIPIVATNNVYFATENMHEAHDALLCIADATYINEENRRTESKEAYFKSPRQMCELFSDIPEAVENTLLIAKRCAVMSENRDPMLPHFQCDEGKDEAEQLKLFAQEGLDARMLAYVYKEDMDDAKKAEFKKLYFERLDYELGIITKMQFPGYFLIVSDFMKWSKQNNVPVGPGRGSGAGSIVAWALQITDLDPIKYGLLFERFLNPERVSMPDFDIDFCQEKRERVIKYVQQKYGYNKVAQIITFGKLQARAVVRDVGRVLQMPYGQIDKITKMIPFNPIDPVTLSKAISMDRDLQNMQKDDPEIGALLGTALKLEGLNRHASTHAAGVVISEKPLEELIPLYKDPRSDMPVAGYSMKYSESAGLVKFDFLGLKTLTVIAKTCEFLARRGIDLDISYIPIDDKKTFELLTKGDSIGVFQLESAGMRDTLRKLRPDNIEDIIAIISLYRPGPMDNIPAYIARKHGTEDPDYLHPMLEDVLKETYGVIIYQEQVMQIAQIMGGYTLGAADLLRRAMGKKIASEMDAQRKIFIEGAVNNEVDKGQASSIFDLVAKFAGYGFNKSHAAAYALISYQTAYLKANYPVEFLAGSLNLDINDTEKINTFCQDAIDLGIKVLLPDINKSKAYFEPEQLEDGSYGIRYALGALKNVGCAAMEQVVKERESEGEFTDIFEFSSKFGSKVLNKRQLENLIRSGSFDKLYDNRKSLYNTAETILKYGQALLEESNSAQVSFFSDDSLGEQVKPKLVDTDDWNATDRLAHEFEAIGLYLGLHPLGYYEKILEKIGLIYARDFESKLTDGGINVKVAGVIAAKKIRSSARGRFATLTLSDPTGLFEVSIYDENLLSSMRDMLENGRMLLVTANVKKDEGGIRIIADDIKDLNSYMENQQLDLQIYLDGLESIENIKNILSQSGKGRSVVKIIYKIGGKELHIDLPTKCKISVENIGEFENMQGVEKVYSSVH